ncbi:MAG: NYN domain-containing protein [Oligoflexia bacterium]|nr:NYN domain-containing protein [Oligoflexia bacterium]
MDYEELGKGIVKRTRRRLIGLFIDGIGLDRACRRLNRKIDLSALVRGVTSGTAPVVARYYTLIPYEDDSRQRSFLDAVAKAGLAVVVKRLPPKGINRQVTVDIEMAADMVAFARGFSSFGALSRYIPEVGQNSNSASAVKAEPEPTAEIKLAPVQEHTDASQESRIVTVVCPDRELAYPLSLIRDFGIDTVSADFGNLHSGDVLKSAAKWIDLSDSETIWRE